MGLLTGLIVFVIIAAITTIIIIYSGFMEALGVLYLVAVIVLFIGYLFWFVNNNG